MAEADVLRVAGSLLLVIALIVALAWLAKRLGGPLAGRHPGLRITATHRLGARASLAVVEFNDQQLLVGVTAQQVTLLHATPLPDASDPTSTFSTMLDRAQHPTAVHR